MYVTNGYISEQALTEIAPFLDAANVDVKAFSDSFYKKISGARLEPVLETCKRITKPECPYCGRSINIQL
ncbi:MAG: hypothetical protein IBX41_02420 [Methanophagales archaeon]|nr:hypothetical protein [Methanophagales archaeon]